MYIGKWRSTIISNYKSTVRLQLAIWEPYDKPKPDENIVIAVIEKLVLSRKGFKEIWNFLFLYSWWPGYGMCMYTICTL